MVPQPGSAQQPPLVSDSSSCNGRDSVSTVVSNSSNETVRFQDDGKENSVLMQHSSTLGGASSKPPPPPQVYHQPKSLTEFAFHEPVAADYGPYASLNFNTSSQVKIVLLKMPFCRLVPLRQAQVEGSCTQLLVSTVRCRHMKKSFLRFNFFRLF